MAGDLYSDAVDPKRVANRQIAGAGRVPRVMRARRQYTSPERGQNGLLDTERGQDRALRAALYCHVLLDHLIPDVSTRIIDVQGLPHDGARRGAEHGRHGRQERALTCYR